MAKKPTYEELEKRVRDLDKRFREVEMKKEGFIVDSENFFVLADKSPDGITIVDSEGRYLYANRSAAEGLGYDSSEFLKMTFSDLVHPDDRDMVSRKFAERTEGRAVPSIYEARFLHKDGSIVFLEVLGMKTMWDGRPASMVIGRDVTACKRTEKELRDSEARYRSIFKNTGTAMAVIDKNEIITSLNREFEKLTGYRREDLEGKKMLGDLSTPEETRRIRNDSYEKLKLKDGVPRHYETVLVTQKGERRDVLMTVFPIPGSS
ncbi:MAG: PAS domain S-box protein, partial [Thermodesulfobacteriota bacterium]|nr:PAS domain S-box protein [Thermodesulfobacteriota bacterium]